MVYSFILQQFNTWKVSTCCCYSADIFFSIFILQILTQNLDRQHCLVKYMNTQNCFSFFISCFNHYIVWRKIDCLKLFFFLFIYFLFFFSHSISNHLTFFFFFFFSFGFLLYTHFNSNDIYIFFLYPSRLINKNKFVFFLSSHFHVFFFF